MYVRRARLFLGIGVLFIPLGCSSIASLQALVLGGFGLRRHRHRPAEAAGVLALLVVAVGTTLTLLGVALVQAATACALVEIDAGRPSARCAPTGWR